MSKELSYRLTDTTATVLHRGRLVSVSGRRREAFVELLQAGERTESWYSQLDAILDPSKNLVDMLGGDVRLEGGQLIVTSTGYVFPEKLAERALKHQQMGVSHNCVITLAGRLALNPSRCTRDALPGFLEAMDIMICEDGCFVGYKAVTWDFKDKRTGQVDNRPGGKITPIPWSMVDDDRSKSCGVHGYHIGSKEYANRFASSTGDRIIAVKVAPENVVCVPSDISEGKIRVTYYEVLHELERGESLGPWEELMEDARRRNRYGEV